MKRVLANEQGFVLVAAIMMLAVLMIIGIAATSTTTIELQISGNGKAATQGFYEAEGTAYEEARWIKDFNWEQGGDYFFLSGSTVDRQTDLSSYIASQQEELNSGIRDPSTWIPEGETDENSSAGTLDNTSFRMMGLGASEGSSLLLNGSNGSLGGIRHKTAIVGRYESTTGGRRGNAMVEIGVRF